MLLNVTSYTNTWFLANFYNGGGAGTAQWNFGFDSTGHIRVKDAIGGGSATSVNAISTATTYSIWLHAHAGSGSNAFAEAEFQTTPTMVGSGNNYTSLSTGTGTANFDNWRIGTTTSHTFTIIADKCYLASTAIGSNP